MDRTLLEVGGLPEKIGRLLDFAMQKRAHKNDVRLKCNRFLFCNVG